MTEEEKAGAALRMHLDSHGSDAADDVKNETFSKCQLSYQDLSNTKLTAIRLALGPYGFLELEHRPPLVELLRHYHTHLFVLVVLANDHQELGIQGSTRTTPDCTSKRWSIL